MLVAEIVADPYSRLVASFNGYAYAPHPADVFFFNWVDAQAQMRHKSGKVPPKPVERPWMAQKSARASTPDPGSEGRRRALMERLGLGRVVEADDQPDGQPESEGDD